MDQSEFDQALSDQAAEQEAEREPEFEEDLESEFEVPADYGEPSYGYQAPAVQYVPMGEDIEDAITENPQSVAVWAIQNEQGHVYERAMEEWYQDDAMAASRFERALDREVLKQEISADPGVANARAQYQQKEIAGAFNTLSAKYPDFEEVMSSATEQDLAGLDPNILLQQSPQGALETAYRWASSSRGRRAATANAKRQASVVTPGMGNSTTPPSVMEKLKSAMLDPEPQDVRANLVR